MAELPLTLLNTEWPVTRRKAITARVGANERPQFKLVKSAPRLV